MACIATGSPNVWQGASFAFRKVAEMAVYALILSQPAEKSDKPIVPVLTGHVNDKPEGS